MTSLDLSSHPVLRRLLRSRWPQLGLQLVAFSGFLIAVVAGWMGTPVGNRNFAIVAVWIAWWALLMLLLVPALGRAWCSVCPLPLAGEWLQRGSLLGPRLDASGQPRPALGLGRRWPARLRNIWLQNGTFLLLALFSAVVLTQPSATGLVLTLILMAALGLGLVFERRAFCRYLCPVSGFIGLYSQAAPLEVRAADPAVCAAHSDKSCYVGTAQGYGCPWDVYPGGLVRSTNCGLCLECLRTCPYDNMVVRLRVPGDELMRPSARGLDEPFKAFIMLGGALVYSAVMLGPWGELKTAAFQIGSRGWLAYAASLLAITLLLLPGLSLGAAALGRMAVRPAVPLKKTFASMAQAYIPLGLSAWMAFSLSFALTNLSYLWPVLSDPMGWGWNLLGTVGLRWQPYLTTFVPPLQIVLLAGGLGWSAWTARRIAGQLGGGLRLAWPTAAVAAACAMTMLWLLLG
jgi:polyferredoxin